MPTLREYLDSLSPSGKKKPNKTLMEYMRKELSAEQPDYAVCLDALSKFLPPATGMFYADAYPLLSESVQKEWNQAFLKWADTQTAAKQPAAFLRMSQAVKARLEQMEKADELSLEIQWFISRFADNSARAVSDAREMRDKTSAEQLRKLLVLPVENWSVDKESLKIFFDILFADFPAEHLEKEYRMFLMRTGLDGSENGVSPLAETKAHETEEKPSVQAVSQKSAPAEESAPERPAECAAPTEEPKKTEQSVSVTSAATPSKASEESDAESPTPENAPAIAAPSETGKEAEAETPTEMPAKKAAPETLPSKSAENATEQPQPFGKANEPGFMKLLERALASAKQEVRNTEKLKESLARSESSLKESERQCEDLTRKLGVARQENAELRMRLEKAERQAESDRETALKMREAAETLQRMNENSAAQALAGYKAELNSALKDILENLADTEAREDIDILSALCDHLLDILKYKGISLEEQ